MYIGNFLGEYSVVAVLTTAIARVRGYFCCSELCSCEFSSDISTGHSIAQGYFSTSTGNGDDLRWPRELQHATSAVLRRLLFDPL
ncbi:hypothetical protein GGR56DRAFT_656926 [Xylariaceae sp. FL0804]|nr:hypothetical protein GGR56DRAFT_656926 [Xylariaceae sp. FL0804]